MVVVSLSGLCIEGPLSLLSEFIDFKKFYIINQINLVSINIKVTIELLNHKTR